MNMVAFIILLLGVGAIVFEFAALSVIKATNPWLKALPSLVPLAALIGTVFFSVARDAWLAELAKTIVSFLERAPTALYLFTILVTAASFWFGRYVWKLSGAKEGKYTVQVVEREDAPDQAKAGLPVILEQKFEDDELSERYTDHAGKATFEVDLDDIFTIRIRNAPDPNAPFLVLASGVGVDEKTKKRFDLVKLAEIPPNAWKKHKAFEIPAKSGNTGVEESSSVVVEEIPDNSVPESLNQSFAQIPPAYFRWRGDGGAVHIIDADRKIANFPFDLPGAETIIRRKAFTIGFSPVLRLPRWVAYRIAPGQPIRRSRDEFKPDPCLSAGYQALSSDYLGNDFDRGHLVRRSDLFGLGQEAARQVFYLSAVVPQLSYVNQKTWHALEEYTSGNAVDGKDVHVIRGPIYQSDGTGKMVNVTLIGKSLVPVPTHFFEILCNKSDARLPVKAFIVPNSYVSFTEVGQFRATVAEIGELTGLIFDAKLFQ